MIRRIALSLLLIVSCVPCAQARNKSADNWYFGYKGGITFVNGSPQAVAGGQSSQLGACALISDANGNLLFYTDGNSVWNHNNTLMPHGTGLAGDPSASQPSVIVPNPAGGIYYVFTVSTTTGLNYSVVDMSLDSGNGDVARKNVNIMATCSEQITAVAHANGYYIWVVARPGGSNAFHAFIVTNVGVSAGPVVSNAGTSTVNIFGQTEYGYLKSSTAGDRLAMTYFYNNTIEVYDFDNSTGVVSNAVNLGPYTEAYGLEFSQNGTRVYVAQYRFQILQFDLTAGVIAASMKVLANSSGTAALQLGPDGKIYATRPGIDALDVITSPNSLAPACNYSHNGVAIFGICEYDLPTFVQSFFAAAAHTTGENTPVAIPTAKFTGAYLTRTGSGLQTVKITTLPTNGSLTIGGNPAVQNAIVPVADLVNVTYTPTAYYSGDDSFGWEGAHGGSYDFSSTATIEITPVAQRPGCTSPTNLKVGQQTTDGLVLSRNAHDGAEVTHFYITAVTGGSLYLADATTQVTSNSFITYAQGAAGLKFKPSAAACGFTVAGATAADVSAVSASTLAVSFTALAPAVLTTTAVSNLAADTASSGGHVTSDGGSTITARGVCWGTSQDPVVTDSHTTDSLAGATFTSAITGLTKNTTYHVRAYATNGWGTTYGTDVPFTTAGEPVQVPVDDPSSTQPSIWQPSRICGATGFTPLPALFFGLMLVKLARSHGRSYVAQPKANPTAGAAARPGNTNMHSIGHWMILL